MKVSANFSSFNIKKGEWNNDYKQLNEVENISDARSIDFLTSDPNEITPAIVESLKAKGFNSRKEVYNAQGVMFKVSFSKGNTEEEVLSLLSKL